MDAPTPTLSAKSPWLIGFGLVAGAQLVFLALKLPLAGLVTWLVAPLLAVWVWRVHGPKLLVAALSFCWVGDVLGNPRQIGIGPIGLYLSIATFAVACVLLIILFVRLIRRSADGPQRTAISGRHRRRAGIAVLPLVLASVVLALIWSDLGPALRGVASIYLLLIVVAATAAFVLDTWTGIGAGLLLGSHLLVALEVGGRLDGTRTLFRLAVLALYMLGILLIAVGVVNRGARTEPRVDDAPDRA